MPIYSQTSSEVNNEVTGDQQVLFTHLQAIQQNSIDKNRSVFDEQEDVKIWDEFKKGNKDALKYIYYKYYPILYSYGHQLTSRTEVIEDCIQDLFVDLNQSREKLSSTTSIKYYLLKSFKTKYLKTIKKEAKVREKVKYYPGYEFHFVISEEDRIINAQLDAERVAKLNKAIKTLPHRQREAIYYYYYECLSLEEISDLMSVSNKRTIQNIIYRSLARLKEHICLSVFFFMQLG